MSLITYHLSLLTYHSSLIMKITCKTTLLPAVPFVGTRIRVRIPHGPDAPMAFSIYNATASGGSEIDWGDGTVEPFTRLNRTVHNYASPGLYEVRIKEGVNPLVVSYKTYDYDRLYSPAILSLVNNDPQLTTLGGWSLIGARNLTSFDTKDSGLSQLTSGQFKNCSSLSGEFYFPKVARMSGTLGDLPFESCTGGITKIHFAEANKAAILATGILDLDPTLGSGTAEVVFDL